MEPSTTASKTASCGDATHGPTMVDVDSMLFRDEDPKDYDEPQDKSSLHRTRTSASHQMHPTAKKNKDKHSNNSSQFSPLDLSLATRCDVTRYHGDTIVRVVDCIDFTENCDSRMERPLTAISPGVLCNNSLSL